MYGVIMEVHAIDFISDWDANYFLKNEYGGKNENDEGRNATDFDRARG